MTNEDLILLKFYRIGDLTSEPSFNNAVSKNLETEEQKELIRILNKIEKGLFFKPERRRQRK